MLSTGLLDAAEVQSVLVPTQNPRGQVKSCFLLIRSGGSVSPRSGQGMPLGQGESRQTVLHFRRRKSQAEKAKSSPDTHTHNKAVLILFGCPLELGRFPGAVRGDWFLPSNPQRIYLPQLCQGAATRIDTPAVVDGEVLRVQKLRGCFRRHPDLTAMLQRGNVT